MATVSCIHTCEEISFWLPSKKGSRSDWLRGDTSQLSTTHSHYGNPVGGAKVKEPLWYPVGDDAYALEEEEDWRDSDDGDGHAEEAKEQVNEQAKGRPHSSLDWIQGGLKLGGEGVELSHGQIHHWRA